jgi:lipid-binding SYLF domain-containing protein
MTKKTTPLFWSVLVLAVYAMMASCAKHAKAPTPGQVSPELRVRLDQADAILYEAVTQRDKGIPLDLLNRAQCIIIIPGLSEHVFVVGVEYGSGFISCRNKNGAGWTPPAGISLKGGSFGAQFGSTSTDLILLLMDKSSEKHLVSGEYTLGVDGSVAAGPIGGRSAAAETNARMGAEILSWSHSHGLFAGVAVDGAKLSPDKKANVEMYGKNVTNQQIVDGKEKPPRAARYLLASLDKYSPRMKP